MIHHLMYDGNCSYHSYGDFLYDRSGIGDIYLDYTEPRWYSSLCATGDDQAANFSTTGMPWYDPFSCYMVSYSWMETNRVQE